MKSLIEIIQNNDEKNQTLIYENQNFKSDLQALKNENYQAIKKTESYKDEIKVLKN